MQMSTRDLLSHNYYLKIVSLCCHIIYCTRDVQQNVIIIVVYRRLEATGSYDQRLFIVFTVSCRCAENK